MKQTVRLTARRALSLSLAAVMAWTAFLGVRPTAVMAADDEPVVVWSNKFPAGSGTTGLNDSATLSLQPLSGTGSDDGRFVRVTRSSTGNYRCLSVPFSQLTGGVEEGDEFEITAKVWVEPTQTVAEGMRWMIQGSGKPYPWMMSPVLIEKGELQTLNARFSYTGDNAVSTLTKIQFATVEDNALTWYIDEITITRTHRAPAENGGDVTEPGGGETQVEGSLKDAYKDYFLFGTATRNGSVDYTNASRLDVITKHFNVVTPENAMKPEAIINSSGAFTLSAVDSLLDNAVAHGMLIHGHTLVWHSQSQAWLTTGDAAQVRERMHFFIDGAIKHFSERYGDKLISYDIVNEAVNDSPPATTVSTWGNALRTSAWKTALGSSYIEEAFLEAWKANPGIKRYYNDYNLDNANKALAVANMVKDINDRYREQVGGNLIQGVGMQAHYGVNRGTTAANVEAQLNRFIALGVDVSISELDVTIASNTSANLNNQAKLYAQLMALYKKNAEHIDRVTVWGIDDATSWRKDEYPLLFTSALAAKPALVAAIAPEKYLGIAEIAPPSKPVPLNKDALRAAIAAAEGRVPGDYTEESWSLFAAAFAAAKDAAESEAVSQLVIDDAAGALAGALAALVVKAPEPPPTPGKPVVTIALDSRETELEGNDVTFGVSVSGLKGVKGIEVQLNASAALADSAVIEGLNGFVALDAQAGGVAWKPSEGGRKAATVTLLYLGGGTKDLNNTEILRVTGAALPVGVVSLAVEGVAIAAVADGGQPKFADVSVAYAGGNSAVTEVVPAYVVTVAAGHGGSVNDVSGGYKQGAKIALAATPNAGYEFKGWTVEGAGVIANAGSADTTFTVGKGDAVVTATFAAVVVIPKYTLKATAGEHGSVKDVNGSYEENTILSLTATPDEGYEFEGWAFVGDGPFIGSFGDPSAAETTFTVGKGNAAIRATFVKAEQKPEPTVNYDLNGDGVVDLLDLSLASMWYKYTDADEGWEKAKAADFNQDGVVDIADLLLLFSNYTSKTPVKAD